MTALDHFMHNTAHDLAIIINTVALIKNERMIISKNEEKIDEWIERIYQAQRNLVRKQDKFYTEHKDKFK